MSAYNVATMKDTFFFSHDYNARSDPKMQKVLMKHGCAGIGAYWCIVEQLYEQGGALPIPDCEIIAFTLRMDEKVIQSIVMDSDLFKNDGVNFWSESVNRRLNKRSEIAEKRKKAAFERWNKPQNDAKKQESNANAMQVHENSMQDYANKEKERKGKENKENTSLNKEDKKAETAKRFTPPSIDEVQSYVSEKNYSVDAESFVAFYQSKNWFVGKNKMKDWHAAVVTWEKRNKNFSTKKQTTTKNVNDIWDNQ